MSDYIEREAALAYPIRKDKCDRKHANKHFIFGIESVIEFVENLPAADVAPVVHSCWIVNGGNPSQGTCGNCGGKGNWRNHYCPNCGARMDKENEHEA